VDLGASVQRLATEGLLIKGGGHRMAAGLTVSETHLEAAMARLTELLQKQGAGAAGVAEMRLDGTLMPSAATSDLIDQLERAGPFGQGAPGPRFALPDVRIGFAREVGSGHLKIACDDGMGGRLDGIAFGAFDGPLGQALVNHGGARFHLAGRLEINEWGGRRQAQLRLDDAAKAAG
jgi:single-stranded-DNA-specific exonuclease